MVAIAIGRQVLKTELGTSTPVVVPSLAFPLNFNLLPAFSGESVPHPEFLGHSFVGELAKHGGVAPPVVPPVVTPSTSPSTAAEGPTSWLAVAMLTLAGVHDPSAVRGWASVTTDTQRTGVVTPPTSSFSDVSMEGKSRVWDGYDCLEFFLFSVSPPPGGQSPSDLAATVGHLRRDRHDTGTRAGLLGRIPQRECRLHNHSRINVPYVGALVVA